MALAWMGFCTGVQAQERFSKDPTVPPAVWLAAQAKSFVGSGGVEGDDAARVQVIVTGKTRKIALVDGKVVHPGDTMDGSTVTSIASSKVTLEDDSKSLSMTPNVVKKSPVAQAAKRKSVVIQSDNMSLKQ